MTPALRSASRIRLLHHIGVATRRQRMPRPKPPLLVESDYAKAIISAIVEPGREAIRPLLDALPNMMSSAARARGIRQDEEPIRLARMLIDRARARFHADQIPGLATRAANQVSAFGRSELDRQAKARLGVSIPTADHHVPTIIHHFVHENVTLIKSLGSRPLDEIEKIVARGFTTNAHVDTIAADIAERYDIAERHARLIARDQIGSLNADITEARHTELGITSFTWRTMNDERVRPEHEALEGETFSYDDPPSEGLPGSDIACRCTAEPSFDDVLSQIDR